MYPDELFYLNKKIKRRIAETRIVALAISHNPHIEPDQQRKLGDLLMGELRGNEPEMSTPTLDREGMNALKARLSSESRFIKVK